MKRILIALCVILFLTCTAKSADTTRPEVESVALLTCHPGDEVYELEGHTALRFIFSDGKDLTVNWGLFDFNSPNFLYRFVKGETDYRMGATPTVHFLNQYSSEGRRVDQTPLNLTPAEREKLVWLIDSTMRIGSPVYRYNYVLDNCATRPVDYLEKAIGHPLQFADTTALGDKAGTTFRGDMTAFHRNYPWYQFGIDLALGPYIDNTLTSREHLFAPVSLALMVDGAMRPDPENPEAYISLSSPRFELLPDLGGGPATPTPWPFSPIAVCSFFCLITIIISIIDLHRHSISRWFDTIYFNIAGLAGLLLTFLIFVSVHYATSPNWLYLWLNPLCFIGGTLIWIKKYRKAVILYQIINFAAIAALCVVVICGAQAINFAFIPLLAADALRAVVYIRSAKWH
ncbi:MAG: DUF4105 domain-containing protein [Muribaculaceae bacterium]|jgi:hypothetical protein|nr:DUF4105 domain-containing protein [Muribaculaceae bacterium]